MRAIHLETVADCTATCFLNALERFIARRGKLSQIICDNAGQFKLVAKTVDQAFQEWKRIFLSEKIKKFCVENDIEWKNEEGLKFKFIVDRSPWAG